MQCVLKVEEVANQYNYTMLFFSILLANPCNGL